MVVDKWILRDIVAYLADVEEGCHFCGTLGIEHLCTEDFGAHLGVEADDVVVCKTCRAPAPLGAAIDEKVAALPTQSRERPERCLISSRHLLDERVYRQHDALAEREIVTQFGAEAEVGKRTAKPALGHPHEDAIQPALGGEIDVVAVVIFGDQFVEELATTVKAL